MRYRPSSGFLVVALALLLVLTAYFWLSAVGGCEDYGGECHRWHGWASVGTLLTAGVIAVEMLRRVSVRRHDSR